MPSVQSFDPQIIASIISGYIAFAIFLLSRHYEGRSNRASKEWKVETEHTMWLRQNANAYAEKLLSSIVEWGAEDWGSDKDRYTKAIIEATRLTEIIFLYSDENSANQLREKVNDWVAYNLARTDSGNYRDRSNAQVRCPIVRNEIVEMLRIAVGNVPLTKPSKRTLWVSLRRLWQH
jgi:hypothetical protein